jgi:8-oxo-dGTP pyrophosphatase MutT (NUDIX family)
MRHVLACANAVLPGGRVPFRVAAVPVGWIGSDMLDALGRFPAVRIADGSATLLDPSALPGIARSLSEQGFFRWRQEAFDVRAQPGAPSLARLDRGAIPSFGVLAEGVHVNGLVEDGGLLHVWVARRAWDKLLDPGKLDHVVAGGVPAGLTPEETLIKEAAEEAAIPAALAANARRVGQVGYTMDRPEGLRRDHLHCFDLTLPAAFTPHAADGEVEAFALWPIGRVMEAVRDTDDFKFNVNLVLIDLFLRLDMIRGTEAAELRAALTAAAG